MFSILGQLQLVKQPVGRVTADDVKRVIHREFTAERFEEVLAIVNEYGLEKWEIEADRVRVAVLKLANGDLERLRARVKRAKRDYRDVLAAAEYPEYMKTGGSGIRKPPSDEQPRSIDRDWRQYYHWFRTTD